MIRKVGLKAFNLSNKIVMVMITLSLTLRLIDGGIYVIVERQLYQDPASSSSGLSRMYFHFLNMLATLLTWTVIYFFIFEIEDVKHRLQWTSSV